jgi:hypothetical protein
MQLVEGNHSIRPTDNFVTTQSDRCPAPRAFATLTTLFPI